MDAVTAGRVSGAPYQLGAPQGALAIPDPDAAPDWADYRAARGRFFERLARDSVVARLELALAADAPPRR